MNTTYNKCSTKIVPMCVVRKSRKVKQYLKHWIQDKMPKSAGFSKHVAVGWMVTEAGLRDYLAQFQKTRSQVNCRVNAD